MHQHPTAASRTRIVDTLAHEVERLIQSTRRSLLVFPKGVRVWVLDQPVDLEGIEISDGHAILAAAKKHISDLDMDYGDRVPPGHPHEQIESDLAIWYDHTHSRWDEDYRAARQALEEADRLFTRMTARFSSDPTDTRLPVTPTALRVLQHVGRAQRLVYLVLRDMFDEERALETDARFDEIRRALLHWAEAVEPSAARGGVA